MTNSTTNGPSDIRRPLVIIFGGQSPEHSVSCSSAAHILRAVDTGKYEVHVIGITLDGTWVHAFNEVSCDEQKDLPQTLDTVGAALNPITFFDRFKETPPVVFPVLHGPNGEDGTIQGFLELMQLPYVGSKVLSSALCMDKLKTKEILKNAGISQTKWIGIHSSQIDQVSTSTLGEELKCPLFVKPSNMGSSIGITKVTERSKLHSALQEAAKYDEWIVVEEGTAGREIEISVLGNTNPKISVPGEIIPGADFYDYKDKYEDGADLRIPADLTDAEIERVQEIALNVYTVLRCRSLARVDFFYDEKLNTWLVNEVNTMPGFTPISMYPKLWSYSGLAYEDLIEELIETAL